MATLFDIKNVAYPATLRTNTGFKISGDLTLFSIPYLPPLWVIATVTYPKQPLEVLGAPQAHMGGLAVGGKFSIEFPKGFDREGQYTLDVRAFLGPTQVTSVGAVTSASVTIPPFPPVASVPQSKFTVAGEGGFPLVGAQVSFGQPLVNGASQPRGIVPNQSITIRCQVNNSSDPATTINGHVDVYQESGVPQVQGTLTSALPFIRVTLPAIQRSNPACEWRGYH